MLKLFIDLNKYNKFEKSSSTAYLFWAVFSIALIIIPDINLAIYWMKKLYVVLCFAFVMATNIYMDYPVFIYIFGSQETKKEMRKILGIDETLSEYEQERHPLVKKIKWNHFCSCICCITMFITFFIIYAPFIDLHGSIQ